MTPEIADSLGLKKTEGALVAEPQANGPAVWLWHRGREESYLSELLGLWDLLINFLGEVFLRLESLGQPFRRQLVDV